VNSINFPERLNGKAQGRKDAESVRASICAHSRSNCQVHQLGGHMYSPSPALRLCAFAPLRSVFYCWRENDSLENSEQIPIRHSSFVIRHSTFPSVPPTSTSLAARQSNFCPWAGSISRCSSSALPSPHRPIPVVCPPGHRR